MGFLGKLAKTLTGGLAEEIFSTVKDYFPPSMSEKEKSQVQMALQNLQDKREARAEQATSEAAQEFNQRIKDLEGTAADLKVIPVLGPIIIFLRGCQRPVWGFLCMYLDFKWFSSWELTEQQQTAMIVINLLVLGFLFGERTVKNLMPLIVKIWGKDK